MSLELYKKILDEAATKNRESVIRIHSVGEPLLWKHLAEAIEYSHKKGVRTWVFTSAVTNDRSLLQTLCMTADIIEVSVNSIDKRDYRKIKGIDAFELVSRNIEYLSAVKSMYKLPVRLIASRVQTEDKTSDDMFVDYWKSTGLVDDAFIRSYNSYNGILERPDLVRGKGKADPCLVHWARFNIDTDGKVAVCFNELFKESLDENVLLGDINNSNISEMWQGQKINAIRDAQFTGDYSRTEFTNKLPCRQCSCCQPLFSHGKTSENQVSMIPKRDGHE
jgi:MoaA/NifB/PqqE/SkfB family radical SAM enzyme